MNHFHQTIQTGMFNFANLYRDLVAGCPSGGTLVEVGSWVGQSLAFLMVEAINSGKSLRVVAVDAFMGNVHSAARMGKNLPQIERFRQNLDPVWEQVRFIKCPSAAAAEFFGHASCHAVMLDADHHRDAIAADLRAWFPRIASGGVLCGHDYRHLPVREAVHQFASQMGLTVTAVPPDCWRVDR